METNFYVGAASFFAFVGLPLSWPLQDFQFFRFFGPPSPPLLRASTKEPMSAYCCPLLRLCILHRCAAFLDGRALFHPGVNALGCAKVEDPSQRNAPDHQLACALAFSGGIAQMR